MRKEGRVCAQVCVCVTYHLLSSRLLRFVHPDGVALRLHIQMAELRPLFRLPPALPSHVTPKTPSSSALGMAAAASFTGVILFSRLTQPGRQLLLTPTDPLSSRLRSPTYTSVRRHVRALRATAVEDGIPKDSDTVPTPKVIIDQDSDPDATVVEITFGDRLGPLLDTMNALKGLGLNVVRANVFPDSSIKRNKLAITKVSTGRKVDDPELLEAIRLTIINNMIHYHPESSTQLALGTAFGVEPPTQLVDVDIATHINVYEDGPERSNYKALGEEVLCHFRCGNLHCLLVVETADRPGLLVDLVKIITDINVSVSSGEFDTEGLLAKAKFHVSYNGKSVIKPLQQVLANSLRYFLRRPSTEEASF